MTAMAISVASPLVALADEGVEKGYTYTYDYWGEVQYSPDAYSVVGVYTAGQLGIEGGFKNPDGLFIKDRFVFVCDTGNNRIIQWERTDNDDFRHVRTINEIKGDVNIKNLLYVIWIILSGAELLVMMVRKILKLDRKLLSASYMQNSRII